MSHFEDGEPLHSNPDRTAICAGGPPTVQQVQIHPSCTISSIANSALQDAAQKATVSWKVCQVPLPSLVLHGRKDAPCIWTSPDATWWSVRPGPCVEARRAAQNTLQARGSQAASTVYQKGNYPQWDEGAWRDEEDGRAMGGDVRRQRGRGRDGSLIRVALRPRTSG